MNDPNVFTFKCFLCDRTIVDEPHSHPFKTLPYYGVTICRSCASHGDIPPAFEDKLIKHMEENDIEKPQPNEDGWLPLYPNMK
ncbi:MAG: hypothetical protein KAR80_07025 [Rhodospirillaceae bacterium]|nr:hypothetical protein [Rhodospirillaceae bacterium]